MRKQYLILTTAVLLALAAMSCGLQVAAPNPNPGPQGPQGPQNGNPVNPGPQAPQNGSPMNAAPQGPGPNPNGGAPGGGQIVSFTADRTTLNQGQCATLQWQTQGGFGAKLNGQLVEPAGQQQVCPQQTTFYGLELDTGGQVLTREITITVTGGGSNPKPVATATTPANPAGTQQPTHTPSSSGPVLNITLVAQIANLDLALTNIYPSSTGHIMVTVKNAGNVNVSGSYEIECSGEKREGRYFGQMEPVTLNANVKLAPGATQDYDTGFSRNPNVAFMEVTCHLIHPDGDTNKANDSQGPVTVKE